MAYQRNGSFKRCSQTGASMQGRQCADGYLCPSLVTIMDPLHTILSLRFVDRREDRMYSNARSHCGIRILIDVRLLYI